MAFFQSTDRRSNPSFRVWRTLRRSRFLTLTAPGRKPMWPLNQRIRHTPHFNHRLWFKSANVKFALPPPGHSLLLRVQFQSTPTCLCCKQSRREPPVWLELGGLSNAPSRWRSALKRRWALIQQPRGRVRRREDKRRLWMTWSQQPAADVFITSRLMAETVKPGLVSLR